MMLDLNTLIAKNEKKFLQSELGDEMVMMNLENGNFIGLNNVGSDILKQIDRPITVDGIISKLLKEYDIEKKECESDVREYLTLLVDKEILIIQKG